jgi:hypothetical protein
MFVGIARRFGQEIDSAYDTPIFFNKDLRSVCSTQVVLLLANHNAKLSLS